MFGLDALLTGGLGIANTIIGNNAAAAHRKKVMEMVGQIMLEQRRNLAEAKNSLQIGKQQYMNDPRRAELLNRYAELSRSGGPYDAATVSAMKSTAGDAIGRNTALAMSQLRESLNKRGIAGSGAAMAAMSGAARNASVDTVRGNTQIDLETGKANDAARRQNLDAYQGLVMGDLKQQYGFGEDYASLLGSVNYGNSLSAISG